MTTTPDFRALCAELVKRLDELNCNFNIPSQSALIECANDALATPPPEPGKSIEELIAGCKPLDPAMAEMLTPDARWRLFGEDDSLPPPPEPPTNKEIAAAIQKGADQEFYATVEALAEYCDCGVELTDSDAREVLYELRRPHIALDCWGNEKHKGVMKM